MTLDRKAGKPCIIYSPAGGMSIEDVAEEDPSKIFKIHIDVNDGLPEEELKQAAANFGIPEQDDQVQALF